MSIKEMNFVDVRSSRESRAKRLKSLRKMTRLSRKAFAEKYNIASGTIQNWESGRFGGLSEKGARDILRAIKAEGIGCTFEWLMYGVEPGPSITERLFLDMGMDARSDFSPAEAEWEAKGQKKQKKQGEAIIQELLAFRKYNNDPIDHVIPDDSMLPRFIAGEHVAGSRRYKEDIAALVGEDCIVHTVDGDTLVRRLRKGIDMGLFTLVCTNLETDTQQPVIYNVELIYAAPIVWARRKETITEEAPGTEQ